MTITLAAAGIRLAPHGAFREALVRSTSNAEKIGHRHTNENGIIEKIVRRRAIVVLAQSEVDLTAITTFIGTSKSSVYRWNNRCAQVNNYKDLPRSGRPSSYTEDIKLKIIAFYCQKRPLPGCGRWSLRWASQHLRGNPECIGTDTPSKSTIQRFLVHNSLKPHRSRYFLHITDPDFFPKMEHLVEFYKNPPLNLFFFDECPGIQILQRLTPDMHTEATKKRIEEFEYIRNGTMDVLAFLNYADGKIYAECRCDHKTDTFLEVFKNHVKEQVPSRKEIHYVMDNLSSHRSYSFCQAVAELSAVQCPPEKELDTMLKRMQWLQMTDKRIIIHFTPYHGSWLNLVEIWFGIMGAKVLGESYNSAENFKAAFDSFIIEWNCILAHPFRWSYDGMGLHQQAVIRFTKMLRSAIEQMDLRILTKMLMLMTNLLKDYIKKVAENVWANFTQTIFAQYTTLQEIIQKEKGPKRKEKAQNALASLMLTIQHCLGCKINECKHF